MQNHAADGREDGGPAFHSKHVTKRAAAVTVSKLELLREATDDIVRIVEAQGGVALQENL
jgi:hypothetical protein